MSLADGAFLPAPRQGHVIVHGKGGKVVVMPIAFDDPKDDLYLEL